MQQTAARFFALVPCAGTGQRAGTAQPKQYQTVAGRSVVAHTLAALAAVHELAATLVVLSPEDELFEAHAPAHQGPSAWVARCGGASRAQSVANGLQALRERGARDDDWVLVHDAARCLIEPASVQALIQACREDAVGGLLAVPLADTLKQQRAAASACAPEACAPRVQSTVARHDKWLAQTPQMFRLGLLSRALAEADAEVTDESSAIEALGHAPLLVPGLASNIKVTWPQDFALSASLLLARAT